MAKKKKKPAGKIISVRVTDYEMETFREIMQVTRKSASTVMREAIRLYIAPAATHAQSG